MSNLWYEQLSPDERLLAEQAVVLYRALRKAVQRLRTEKFWG